MASTPGTPTTQASYTPVHQDSILSAFRTMLTHISELFTPDNASSLAYINGLPFPTGNTPPKSLDVLVELEKRGVFSHENVEPLIGLLTDLHRVDIINTCGVRDYKEKAEQAKLLRGESFGSMKLNDGSSSRNQSFDLSGSNSGMFDKSRNGSESRSDIRSGSGMGHRTPDISNSQLSLQQLVSPLASEAVSPKAPCSSSSSEDCLLIASPSPTTTHGSCKKLVELSEEAKAKLIVELAGDPQAVSLMREVVSKGESTGDGRGNTSSYAGTQIQSLCIRNDSVDDEITGRAGMADELLSPPVEFKSLDPSKSYQQQTSTTSTQTDEESSLSLTQAAAIGSLASSRETECTSGYGSLPTSLPGQGVEPHHPAAPGSLTLLLGNLQSPSSSSSSSISATAVSPLAGQGNGNIATPKTTPSTSPSISSSLSSKQALKFDSAINATKLSWKVKRLNLCEIICKHSRKDISKDLKLSCTSHGTPKRCRKTGSNWVKLIFHLYPYGFGPDEGTFMSMRVCVRVDQKMYLKDLATVHLKITTRLPPGEFVTVRTEANKLEDFVLNNLIPHDVIINQNSKNVEFLIEAYLTYDNLQGDPASGTGDEELMESVTVIEDDNAEGFTDLGQQVVDLVDAAH